MFSRQMQSLSKPVHATRPRLQIKQGVIAHHFFQFRSPLQKLARIEHEVTQIQFVRVPETMLSIPADYEYIAHLQFVFLDLR